MRRKARLTITLPNDLLGQIDRQIDGKVIRNRSHAIETLIRQSLSPAVSTAAILAGGQQAGEENPALKELLDKKLIQIIVSLLIEHGIRRVIMLAGAAEREIRELLGDGTGGVRFHYVEETVPLGTAGALKAAEQR